MEPIISSAHPTGSTVKVQGCLHSWAWDLLGQECLPRRALVLACIHRMVRECFLGQGWVRHSRALDLVCL